MTRSQLLPEQQAPWMRTIVLFPEGFIDAKCSEIPSELASGANGG